ncbi:hypothetical protein Purlil1_2273 [Purpureocillium lilacinum]|uniref:Hydrophobin n=1 Tax=Purpureocillium lilacinum TaxID=33203 RepID=A0ABR0C9R9_PURLI|nr:hypothetical protein Purlil1_2273 [Purpureocillium lilacinum]
MEVGSATHGTRIRDATSTSRHRQTAPGVVAWASCSFLHCACMLGPHPLHPPSLDVAFGVCGPHVAPRRSETTPARRVTVQTCRSGGPSPLSPLRLAVPCLGRHLPPLGQPRCQLRLAPPPSLNLPEVVPALPLSTLAGRPAARDALGPSSKAGRSSTSAPPRPNITMQLVSYPRSSADVDTSVLGFNPRRDSKSPPHAVSKAIQMDIKDALDPAQISASLLIHSSIQFQASPAPSFAQQHHRRYPTHQSKNPPTFKMKFFVAVLALAATAIAAPTECKSCHKEPSHEHKPEHKEPSNNKVGNVCQSHQTVVCQGQGNGGLLSLGNILPGALGQNCAGGDVYCCSHDDVKQVGLINLDLNVQCSLNRLL